MRLQIALRRAFEVRFKQAGGDFHSGMLPLANLADPIHPNLPITEPAASLKMTSDAISSHLRFVLDTDVLVAARAAGTEPSWQLVDRAEKGEFTLLLSVPVILEYKAVLTREEHRKTRQTLSFSVHYEKFRGWFHPCIYAGLERVALSYALVRGISRPFLDDNPTSNSRSQRRRTNPTSRTGSANRRSMNLRSVRGDAFSKFSD